MSEGLTGAARRALRWIAENEPVAMFPLDGSGPSLRFVRALEKGGLVERVGKESGRGLFSGCTMFALTEEARRRLGPNA